MKLCIHSLQNMPPSCVNRDNDGHLKKIVMGGVERNRVSSQSWKRQVRLMMNDLLSTENVSYRTRYVYEKVADEMSKIVDAEKEDLIAYVKTALKKTVKIEAKTEKTDNNNSTDNNEEDKKAKGKKSGEKSAQEENAEEEKKGSALTSILLFLSEREIENLAVLLADEYKKNPDLTKIEKKALKELTQKVHKALTTDISCDIALFGRMIATESKTCDLGVEGSCFFADAFSTHAAYIEPDFFTTVDDLSMEVEEKNTGAGYLDNTEIAAPTYYRYAGIDIDGLKKNMGDKAGMTPEIVDCFIKAFLKSAPMGKSHAYGQFTLPAMTVITISDDCPYNLSPAFEKPVLADYDGGYMENSIKAMDKYMLDITKDFNLEYNFVGHVGVQNVENFGEEYSLNQILDEIHKYI